MTRIHTGFAGIISAWLLATTVPVLGEISVFQHGVNGYQGGQDSAIRVAIEMDRFRINDDDPSCNVHCHDGVLGGDLGAYEHWSTNGGGSPVLEAGHFFQNQLGFMGRPGPTYRYGKIFLRFGDVIGTGAGQIPADARIDNATLTLHHQEDLGAVVASSYVADNPGTAKGPVLNSGNIRVSPLLQPIAFGTSDGYYSDGEVTARFRTWRPPGVISGNGMIIEGNGEHWAQGCKGSDYEFDPNPTSDADWGAIYVLDNDAFGAIDYCGPADGIDHDESRAVDYYQDQVAGAQDINVTSIVRNLIGDGVLINVVHDPDNPMLPQPNGPNWGAAYRSNEYPMHESRPQLTIEYTLGAILAGDANGDGAVDVADLGIVGANFGQSGKTFADGDFNDDGSVDVADLGIVGANWSTAQVTSTADLAALVPEPAVLGMLLMSLPLLTKRRRSH